MSLNAYSFDVPFEAEKQEAVQERAFSNDLFSDHTAVFKTNPTYEPEVPPDHRDQ